jgi:hypothetical protein
MRKGPFAPPFKPDRAADIFSLHTCIIHACGYRVDVEILFIVPFLVAIAYPLMLAVAQIFQSALWHFGGNVFPHLVRLYPVARPRPCRSLVEECRRSQVQPRIDRLRGSTPDFHRAQSGAQVLVRDPDIHASWGSFYSLLFSVHRPMRIQGSTSSAPIKIRRTLTPTRHATPRHATTLNGGGILPVPVPRSVKNCSGAPPGTCAPGHHRAAD